MWSRYGKDFLYSSAPSQVGEAVDTIDRVPLAEIDRMIADLTALRIELDRVIGSYRHGTEADCKFVEMLGLRRASN